MTKPKASKRTAVNLITNGDFSAGNSGWASNTGGTVRVEGGLLLLSAANQHSAVQTVTGLSASENYKLTFSYRVRRKGDNDGYVSVNGKNIDSLETVAEGEDFVKSADHFVTGVTKVDLVFTTTERAVTIDNVVLELSTHRTYLTVSAETVEHDQTIVCGLYAYSPAGEPLINAPVTWNVNGNGSIIISSSSSSTNARGHATCSVRENTSEPEGIGRGIITVGINGTQLTSPILTFKPRAK